ncbi:MAG: hypothetical protein BWY46_00089 [Firmicutes bacterium ADurb.Bin300]|nr:MAG: hypothetical protein BWY46_00089 [Firmicutes bacterium ADurb.Bin300]
MRLFKLAFGLIYRHMLLHAALIIQMTAVFLILANIVSTICLNLYSGNMMKNIFTQDFYRLEVLTERFLRVSTGGMTDISEIEAFDPEKVRGELKGDPVFCNEYVYPAFFADGRCLDLIFQDERLIKNTNFLLRGTANIEASEKEEGVIRIITAGGNYKTGDSLRGYIEVEDKTVECEFKVAGTLKKPYSYLSATNSAVSLSASVIAEELMPGQAIAFLDDMPDVTLKSANDYSGFCIYHVFFDDSLTSKEKAGNLATLQKYGSVTSAKEIEENTKKEISIWLEKKLPSLIFAAVIAVSGLSAVSLINISGNMNTFSLYCLSGCTKKRLYAIILVYILFIVSVSFIPAIGVLLISGFFRRLAAAFVFINHYTFITLGITALTLILIPVLFSLFAFRRKPLRAMILDYKKQ